MTGCETENRYKIYEADDNQKVTRGAIFRCKERSSFCARNPLSGDCRPFSMDIEHNDKFVSDLQEKNMFLRLNRPCKPTFLCFARPSIEVFLSENGVEGYFGKITSKWNCINIVFDVYDKEDRIVYTIWGSGC